ncbi:timeless protein-domain-containing protein [Myxozyma melibiosi]|uniref:Topoisomerase 1-associated factor 1 n=1 Tax=Myxozyma melibiosi TaxID=54550 RepID=A0ABR1F5J3_9ASCO
MDQLEASAGFVRASVGQLVSALGGPAHYLPDAPYELGDDALGCLKDLKLWIKAYDEKRNSLAVAKAIAESGLVEKDLLRIITDWEAAGRAVGAPYRICLACIELLVPLTWPVQLEGARYTAETNMQKPHVERAQRSYKRTVLTYPTGTALSSIVCIALPSIAKDRRKRNSRDEAIIRLVLYFLRNIALIDMSPTDPEGVDDGRSATIVAFGQQNIFDLVAVLASGIEDEMKTLNLALLELLFHLLKGIDPASLFKADEPKPVETVEKSWLAPEGGHRARVRASRHNRFGTMTSLVINGTNRVTISGPKAIDGTKNAIDKLDSIKTWRRHEGGGRKKEVDESPLEKPAQISKEATKVLASFVGSFLDTSFNPLFISVRKEIERESERVEEHHHVQFAFLVSWFLNAELERQRRTPNEELGFGLVAGVLDHQSLITITKLMREATESKLMTKLAYGMDAFRNILLVASEMARSTVETDREIAENMISRLFYEETTLELIAKLPGAVIKAHMVLLQGCCDLIYVTLKILETFSKQGKLFVKHKKRQHRKSKANPSSSNTKKRKAGSDGADSADEDQISDVNDDDALTHIATSAADAEREFEFARFESRFLTQNCVDMYRKVFANYAELSDQQIKRVISFFHRVFFKDQEEALLFRMDFVFLLYRCLDPVRGIPYTKSSRADVEQFMKHFVRRLVKAFKERPAYHIEILFSKMAGSLHFLKNGYDDAPRQSKKRRSDHFDAAVKKSPDDLMDDIYAEILEQHAAAAGAEPAEEEGASDAAVAEALAEKRRMKFEAAQEEMEDFIDDEEFDGDEDGLFVSKPRKQAEVVDDGPTAEELEAMMEAHDAEETAGPSGAPEAGNHLEGPTEEELEALDDIEVEATAEAGNHPEGPTEEELEALNDIEVEATAFLTETSTTSASGETKAANETLASELTDAEDSVLDQLFTDDATSPPTPAPRSPVKTAVNEEEKTADEIESGDAQLDSGIMIDV